MYWTSNFEFLSCVPVFPGIDLLLASFAGKEAWDIRTRQSIEPLEWEVHCSSYSSIPIPSISSHCKINERDKLAEEGFCDSNDLHQRQMR